MRQKYSDFFFYFQFQLLFSFLDYCKLNIFGFQIAAGTKQDVNTSPQEFITILLYFID